MALRDGDWTLFDYDFKTGRTVWHHFDGQNNHWRVDQPVDEVLKVNAAARNDHTNARWKEGRRVASIPLQLMEKDGLNEAFDQMDEKYLSRWLNDPDNRAFRTFEGNV